MDYKKLNRLLLELLENLKDHIPTELYESNKQYISVGEEGIAFDCMCSYIDDYNIIITRELFEKITTIGLAMGVSSDEWSFLQRHIK